MSLLHEGVGELCDRSSVLELMADLGAKDNGEVSQQIITTRSH